MDLDQTKPEISLQTTMIALDDIFFGHAMKRKDLFGKSVMLRKVKGNRK